MTPLASMPAYTGTRMRDENRGHVCARHTGGADGSDHTPIHPLVCCTNGEEEEEEEDEEEERGNFCLMERTVCDVDPTDEEVDTRTGANRVQPSTG